MKKNVLLIAGVAWLSLAALSASTFAANLWEDSKSSKTTLRQNRSFSGEKLRQGIQGMMWREKMMGNGMRDGMGLKLGSGLQQNMQEIHNAITKKDYAAYLTAYEKGKLTQDQFNQLVVQDTNKTAMETAITNNDYTAYLAAIKGTKMEGKITQAQFSQMVTTHQQRTALRTAITNNDYTAYLAAIKGTKMEGKVTQAQFSQMVSREQNDTNKTQ